MGRAYRRMRCMRTLLDRDTEEPKLLSRPHEKALLAEHAEAVVSMTALFEGEAWHEEVQRFTELLTSKLGDEIALQVRQWTYSELQHLRAERIASELAEQTDVLLLVTHADAVLPEAVGRWIAAWLRQANAACAAVCLVGLNEGASAESGVARNLRNACEHAKVEFFVSSFKLDASRKSIASSPRQLPRYHIHASGIMHWGINE
jgi:hypothetical protein